MASGRTTRTEILVDADSSGLRLDRWLRRLLPRIPYAHLQRMLRKGEVLRAGPAGRLPARAGERVRTGEVYTLSVAPGDRPGPSESDAERPETSCGIPILYDDGHVLAFDKPAGTAVHPGTGHALADTVLGALLARPGRRSASFTPALVGRLDRDASGVQLAGVSPEGLRGLEALARSRGIRKTYLALASDPGLPDSGLIGTPLVDLGAGRARMKTAEDLPGRPPGPAEALPAETRYRVLARTGGLALLEVEPLTGRRHQIRAHMASAGAPLAGDARYGEAAANERLAGRCGLRRLFLHCARAGFVHPVTGRHLTIESPLPRELALALGRLGFPAGAGRVPGDSAGTRRWARGRGR